MEEEFKRLNFFKGFFTQAEDWQAAELYHREKRRFHNKYLHTPGIVHGCLENFAVTAAEEGKAIVIGPGFAIDGEGRELFLPMSEPKAIDPTTLQAPGTIYIVARYREKEIDPRRNEGHPEYSGGHAFIQERPEIDIIRDAPNIDEAVELARIQLTNGAKRINDAADPKSPGPDEIDRSHIRWAGAVRAAIRFRDIAKLVKDGNIGVVAGEKGKGDTNVLIEVIASGAPQPLYLASVYGAEGSRIQWRIETFKREGSIEYRLMLTNLSQHDTTASYEVYRLW